MTDQNTIIIIVIIIVVVALIYYFFFKPAVPTETFRETKNIDDQPLSKYYDESQLNDVAIDKLACHPSCCGNQWPVPFDGLTAEQIQHKIADMGNIGPYIRTGYTCANGPNGIGCPCVTPKAYANLVNRGQSQFNTPIDPTLLTQEKPVFATKNNSLNSIGPLFDNVSDNKQIFVEQRRLNDLNLQRQLFDINNVHAIC